MSKLHAAVTETNQQGNLALMIYAIPNYPNPNVYKETLQLLHNHPTVTIIEITAPVTSKFSEFANSTIQHAHKQAVTFADDVTLIESMQHFHKPSIYVLYQETLEKLGYETILKKIQGKIDGLLFEWDVPNIESYVELANQYGVELIQCAVPEMDATEIKKYLDLAIENPLIYLTSASMTGADISPVDELATCTKLVKTYRPSAKVMAGFGVRNKDDIERLSRIEELDGVIIGTAFLEVMKLGAKQVSTYLDGLTPALMGVRGKTW